MPSLTSADYQLLRDLRKPNVLTLGKQRVRQLLDVVDRALVDTHQYEMEIAQARQAGRFEAAALRIAAHGLVSADEISEKGLPDDLREECLHLRQQYDDAAAYRALEATKTPADVINEPADAAH